YEKFASGIEDTSLGKEVSKCSEAEDTEPSDEPETKPASEEAPTMHVWVSRFEHDLTRVEIFDEEARLDVDFKFNQTVSVKAPDESMSVEEFYEQFQAAMMDFYMEAMSMQPVDPYGRTLR